MQHQNIKFSMLTFIIGVMLLITSTVDAQQLKVGKSQLEISLGTKIGGASPLSLPIEIREIKSYKPAVPFYVGVNWNYGITDRWGIRTGLIFEGKGMNTEASVKGYKTTFNAAEDPSQNVRGYYYGDISTIVENLYFTVPVLANYQLSDRWSLHAGPYVSFTARSRFHGEAISGYIRDEEPTGERIGIEHAGYNFDKSVRKVDVGMSIGAKYGFGSKYFASSQFDYGFNNIMKTGFESISFGLHNIFLNVGVGMRIY